MDKRPVRFHKLLSGPKLKDGKGEKSDVDGMDDGNGGGSEDPEHDKADMVPTERGAAWSGPKPRGG